MPRDADPNKPNNNRAQAKGVSTSPLALEAMHELRTNLPPPFVLEEKEKELWGLRAPHIPKTEFFRSYLFVGPDQTNPD